MYFHTDIKLIKNNKMPSNQLIRLSPFMDEVGVLRVGGRLSNAELPFESRHPAILPKSDHVTKLIIDHYHKFHCHAGSGLLLSILRQRFWIISARSIVRQRVRLCNFCFKNSPSHPYPKMGELPPCRVNETKAFVHTGVDYAGPINITLCRRRGQRHQKAYICLFVCLATKAIHIELVSELSSDAFLSAFKRFISRRGPVLNMYSDNGTNFIGAKAHLKELYNFLADHHYHDLISREMANNRIQWHLIPPRAPNFGGLWEANVKSLKTHLYRVIGAQLLTYEELITVLTQVEALLNSRPLCVISADPYPEALTPAHFLMNNPIEFLPAYDFFETSSVNLIKRKHLLDSMVQSYWKRWRLEYLHTLQVRQKWCKPSNPVKIGTIVLVHQDSSPPLRWPLGVIEEIYPGKDGVTRVALVKTKAGSFKRPVNKLCPLPSQ